MRASKEKTLIKRSSTIQLSANELQHRPSVIEKQVDFLSKTFAKHQQQQQQQQQQHQYHQQLQLQQHGNLYTSNPHDEIIWNTSSRLGSSSSSVTGPIHGQAQSKRLSVGIRNKIPGQSKQEQQAKLKQHYNHNNDNRPHRATTSNDSTSLVLSSDQVATLTNDEPGNETDRASCWNTIAKLLYSLLLCSMIALCWMVVIHTLKWVAIKGNELDIATSPLAVMSSQMDQLNQFDQQQHQKQNLSSNNVVNYDTNPYSINDQSSDLQMRASSSNHLLGLPKTPLQESQLPLLVDDLQVKPSLLLNTNKLNQQQQNQLNNNHNHDTDNNNNFKHTNVDHHQQHHHHHQQQKQQSSIRHNQIQRHGRLVRQDEDQSSSTLQPLIDETFVSGTTSLSVEQAATTLDSTLSPLNEPGGSLESGDENADDLNSSLFAKSGQASTNEASLPSVPNLAQGSPKNPAHVPLLLVVGTSGRPLARAPIVGSVGQPQQLLYKAPFFTSWYIASWNIFFMPVFTLISSCCFRGEDSSTKRLLVRESINQFMDNGLTTMQFLIRCGLFSIVWMATIFGLVYALGNLDATAVMALYSFSSSLTYFLSWVILHHQFVGIRIVAVIICTTGIALLAYMDNSRFLGSVLIVTGSAFYSAIYKVLYQRIFGFWSIAQMSLFFTIVGLFNALLMWPFTLLLYFFNLEIIVWRHIPWVHLSAAGGLHLTANVISYIGSVCTYDIFLTLGLLMAVGLSSIVDITYYRIAFSGMKLGGILLLALGFLVCLLPEDWNEHIAKLFKKQVDSFKRRKSLKKGGNKVQDMSTGQISRLRTASGRVK